MIYDIEKCDSFKRKIPIIKLDNGRIKSLAFSSEAVGETDERHNFYICTDKQICRRQRCAVKGCGYPTYGEGENINGTKIYSTWRGHYYDNRK